MKHEGFDWKYALGHCLWFGIPLVVFTAVVFMDRWVIERFITEEVRQSTVVQWAWIAFGFGIALWTLLEWRRFRNTTR